MKRITQIYLHVCALIRDCKWRWHLKGIKRALRNHGGNGLNLSPEKTLKTIPAIFDWALFGKKSGECMDKIIKKITSARFLMALSFTITACAGFLMNMLPAEAFMTLCGVVVHGYFAKTRPQENPLNGRHPT